MTIKVLNSPLCPEPSSLKLPHQAEGTFIKVNYQGVDVVISTPALKEGVTIQFEQQESGIYLPAENTIPNNTGSPKAERDDSSNKVILINFGLKEDKEKLTYAIIDLCKKVELLDRSECQPADLVEVLSSKGLVPGSKKIRLGCKNNVFRYFLFGITGSFESLNCSNIERSGVFFDKDNNPLKAAALYEAGRSKKRLAHADVIDSIVKKLK